VHKKTASYFKPLCQAPYVLLQSVVISDDRNEVRETIIHLDVLLQQLGPSVRYIHLYCDILSVAAAPEDGNIVVASSVVAEIGSNTLQPHE
jgi:hypothetical protein